MIIYNNPENYGVYTLQNKSFSNYTEYNNKYASYIICLCGSTRCGQRPHVYTNDRTIELNGGINGYGANYYGELNYFYFNGMVQSTTGGCESCIGTLGKVCPFTYFFNYGSPFTVCVPTTTAFTLCTINNCCNSCTYLQAIGNLSSITLSYYCHCRSVSGCCYCCNFNYPIIYEYDSSCCKNIYVNGTKISDNGVICYLIWTNSYTLLCGNVCASACVGPTGIYIMSGTVKYMNSII